MKITGLSVLRLAFSLVFCLVLGAAPALGADGASAGDDGDQPGYRCGMWVSYLTDERTKLDDYSAVGVTPYWGFFLKRPEPGWVSAWELAFEVYYHHWTGDESGNFETGFSPTLRWHYGYDQPVSPYLEVSTGVLYLDGDSPDTGSSLNFDSHFGLGLNFRVTDSLRLSTGYRLRHISNAGLDEVNGGLNTHQFLMGFSHSY